jgi:Uma2 family endonuclease
MMAREFTEDDFLYPESDHMPKADSDVHRKVMTDVIARLEARYAARPDVYVSGGLRVYHEKWNPYDVVVPDCFVAFGVPKHDRDAYRGWQEERMPSVVIEVVTKYTVMMDESTKPRTYADDWKVDEYFLFDPLEEYLDPSLQGFKRAKDGMKPIKPEKDGSLASKKLGVSLSRDGSRLVLRDAVTGQVVLTEPEAEVARLTARLAAFRRS